MTFSHALSTNNYGPAKFIVDASAANGTHTTIASALTSASSGDTIFIRPGTYTENLTLKAGVNLTAFGSDSSFNATGKVIISGTCTLTAAGSVTISGIQLQTNSAALLAVTGSAASVVMLQNCYLNCTNNTGITFSSSSASALIQIQYCTGNLGTTGIAYHTSSSAGNIVFEYCEMSNSGASTTVTSNSAGSSFYKYSSFASPLGTTSTGGISVQHCTVNCSALNAAAITANGTGSSALSYGFISAGTASAITVGAGAALNISYCDINSSNTNAVTGAGTIGLFYPAFSGSSRFINTTTQNANGGAQGYTGSAALASGPIGEQISSATSTTGIATTTTGNVTSISLTAGIWDVSSVANATATTVSVLQSGISVNSASYAGTTIGDSQYTEQGAASNLTVVIPSLRVTLTATTTYYLVATPTYAGGTPTINGRISATRVG